MAMETEIKPAVQSEGSESVASGAGARSTPITILYSAIVTSLSSLDADLFIVS